MSECTRDDDCFCITCELSREKMKLRRELAALRAQLADAMKVVDAVRVWSDNPLTERDADLAEALRDYDAKHIK